MTNADKTPKTDEPDISTVVAQLDELRYQLGEMGKRLTELHKWLVRRALNDLDGSDASAVSILTGYSKEELDDLGGLPAHLLAGRLEVQQQQRKARADGA